MLGIKVQFIITVAENNNKSKYDDINKGKHIVDCQYILS